MSLSAFHARERLCRNSMFEPLDLAMRLIAVGLDKSLLGSAALPAGIMCSDSRGWSNDRDWRNDRGRRSGVSWDSKWRGGHRRVVVQGLDLRADCREGRHGTGAELLRLCKCSERSLL
jgi:hypothetical protein